MACDERGGLAETTGRRHDHFLIGGPGHRAGSSGHRQQPVGVVFTPAAPQPIVPVLAEASAPQATDQTLGDHLIKALPVLLRDEDPDKHGTTHTADGVTEEKLFRRVNILSSLLREALDGDTQANGGGGTAMRKPAIITPDY